MNSKTPAQQVGLLLRGHLLSSKTASKNEFFNVPSDSTVPADRRTVKFPPHTDFRREIRSSVDEYFRSQNQSKFGGAKMLTKSAVILTWMTLSYALLVFWAEHPLIIGLAIFSLSFSIAGVGFAIQHDAGHGSYSRHPWVNRFFATMLDFIGGSSYVWKFKHNFLHHQYTNISGIDADLQDGTFVRLAPQQPLRNYHRQQHIFTWALYGVLAMKWHVYDDFADLFSKRVGGQKMASPALSDTFGLIAGKLFFVLWALAIPTIIHGWWITLSVYMVCSMILGVTLATVFQLAHCVEEVDFFSSRPTVSPNSKEQTQGQAHTLPLEWTRHQLATTCNFARNSPFWTWYLGGLNFQIEHHLFPKISHIHYPAIAPLVEELCRKHHVPYHQIPSFGAAVRSHFRFLKQLGSEAQQPSTLQKGNQEFATPMESSTGHHATPSIATPLPTPEPSAILPR